MIMPMQTFTITFDQQRLEHLSQLITAAGKSPATDANVMVAAAEMLQFLKQQITAQQEVTPEPKSNGHDEHVTH